MEQFGWQHNFTQINSPLVATNYHKVAPLLHKENV